MITKNINITNHTKNIFIVTKILADCSLNILFPSGLHALVRFLGALQERQFFEPIEVLC